jgi:hypothetical protein
MKQCPFCKESIKVEAVKCRCCGEFLTADAPTHTTTQAPPLITPPNFGGLADGPILNSMPDDPAASSAKFIVNKLLLWFVLVPLFLLLLWVLLR